MSRLVCTFAFAIALTSPAMASTGPVFLPDLTFPDPVVSPDVATKDQTGK